MSEVRSINHGDIDLFELLETLWNGKWKIIATSLIAVIIGIVFIVEKPNSFEVITPIQSGKQSVFLQYTSLNNLLESNKFLLSVDEESVFSMFVVEFNDYKEMVDAVSSSEFVQKSIKDLDDKGKERALIGFAKLFKLSAPSKNNNKWTLYFEWHDSLEGVHLLNDAIRKVLSNIKDAIKANFENLALNIDINNTRELEILHNQLSLLSQEVDERENKRIQYLI